MKLRVKEILKSKGVTATSLAERVGITRANTSNIINGKTHPSLPTLEKIAQAIDVDIRELFEPTKEPQTKEPIYIKRGESYIQIGELSVLDILEKFEI